MADASTVQELVLHWQELREQGRTVSAEELCAGCPELLDDLRSQLAALQSIEQFLDATPTSVGQAEMPPAGWSGRDDTPLLGSRYRPLRLHAQGGLGEVYVARDEELSREVALKRLRRPHAGDADSRRRFLREGEITGGLEHPGVVPVYGLTRDADGQPCYAMRFIRGQTLQEAITRLHATAERERGLALRQLLGRFVVVCNTLAYAHSRGVVHRDLKPANIMLGDYGETLVVDWGLAKRVDLAGETQPPGGDCSPSHPRDDGEDGTATGDVLGTPAFMSPEQAAGRPDAIGPASDIYGLGATLYALLTARPPFAGGSVRELLQKVEHGDFAPPRQLRPDIPRALEAICLKAMAREPSTRYGTALELADDLERWLADEPVRAYRDPLAARARRWVRRHRTLVASVTSTLLLAVLLGGAAGLWWWQERSELRRGVQTGLDKAAVLRDAVRWAEARAVLDQVADRLRAGGPIDLEQRLDLARADLELVTRLEGVRMKKARWTVHRYDFASADREYAQEFASLGVVEGQDPAEVAALLGASAVKPQLVAALDDWALSTPDDSRRAWALRVAREADPDPWGNQFRDPAVLKDPAALKDLAARADVAALSPQLLAYLAGRLPRADAVELLTRAQRHQPNDFWLNHNLADKHWYLGNVDETIAYCRAALAVRPDEAGTVANLGVALREKKQLDDAIFYFRLALDLDPTDAFTHHNLGVTFIDQKDPDSAIACFRKAIELYPEYADAHRNWGVALQQKHLPIQAADEWRAALRIDPRHWGAHHDIGSFYSQQQRWDEAIAEYKAAIDSKPDFPEPRFNLGLALVSKGEYEATVRAFREAHERSAKRPDLRNLSADWARRAERYPVLDKELPAVLAGTADPADSAHLMELARFGTHQKRRFVEVAALFERSFARHPEWAAGQGSVRPRYYAAVTAVMAASDEGQEASRLDEAARRHLREQARLWYRADLDAWAAVVERGTAAEVRVLREQLQYWKVDGWGSSVRDRDSLSKLPPTERAAWERFWADVDNLLRRAG
jgi:serine/threonine-protein kinase